MISGCDYTESGREREFEMSSYFANSYMSDMRNGGVVPAEHPHQQHQHYGAAVVPQGNPAQDPNCDPNVVGLRQGIPPHHYGGPPAAGQPPQGMPYPRFPPYDRMDIRNAAYYGAQQGMPVEGYRPDSPGAMHMGQPNGHQTPVVYASCKLQAAVGTNGIVGGPGSPPDLVDTGPPMNNHHHHQPPPQHHINHQQHHPHQHPQPNHNHMMYNNVNQPPQPHHQQVVVNQPPAQPPPQQPPNNNNNSNLPSPLYPWMRSQFGKFTLLVYLCGFRYFIYM